MKLTKLSAAWLPGWTCRLMPAPANVGRGHRFAAYPRCSTDAEGRWRLTKNPVPWGTVISCAAAAVLGVTAIVLAGRSYETPQGYSAPLFPAVDRGIEGMNGVSVLLLLGAGCLPSLFGRAHPVLIGLATMALFPVMSVAELIADPTSHNLLPFEWLLYGLETAPGIIGAFVGRWYGRVVFGLGPSGNSAG